jgi:hypothetical protein
MFALIAPEIDRKRASIERTPTHTNWLYQSMERYTS